MGDKANNDTKASNANAVGAAAPVTQYQFAQKPPEYSGWEGFSRFMWNPETKEFMGRTGCSWLKIGVYYLIYYTFLTGYFIAMLLIFYQTLDDKEPKWKNSNGIIGDNPGVGFRPAPETVESTLIWYRHGTYAPDHKNNWKEWVERLEDSLEPYQKLMSTKDKPNADMIDCTLDKGAGPSQICKVDVEPLLKGDCSKENDFGFRDGQPCILLKINKIFGWVPEPYQNASSLPEELPSEVRAYVSDPSHAAELGKMVWLSCEGENPADRENIGPIEYLPRPGVPVYHYPYENQDGYVSPAIFAHFTNPKKGVLISITCKGWAHNIQHNTMERRGSVHLELMID